VATEVLLAGHVRGKRRTGALRHLPGGWSDTTLPVNVVLVDHPLGLCLFDAGLGTRITRAGGTPWHPWLRLARFERAEGDAVAAALEARGAHRRDVRWLVLSHLHVDHVGGVGEFPDAHVVVSRVEWARAQGPVGRLRGYVPDLWPAALAPRLVDFQPPALGPFSGRYDLAGDGTLLVVPTPGHTPGHLSLLVELDGRRVLCGGDLAPSIEELRIAAPSIADWCAANAVEYVGAHGAGARG
jgi:glyoxylase-like metal-dependent hydrolase (beta-lactamase superfamily II)